MSSTIPSQASFLGLCTFPTFPQPLTSGCPRATVLDTFSSLIYLTLLVTSWKLMILNSILHSQLPMCILAQISPLNHFLFGLSTCMSNKVRQTKHFQNSTPGHLPKPFPPSFFTILGTDKVLRPWPWSYPCYLFSIYHTSNLLVSCIGSSFTKFLEDNCFWHSYHCLHNVSCC